MDHSQHKFLTTVIVFALTVIGIFVGSRLKEISLGAINIGLLLVNALLLLVILGILLQIKDNISIKNKKGADNFGK